MKTKLFPFLVFALGLIACDVVDNVETDAGTDAGTDVETDTETDVETDTGPVDG